LPLLADSLAAADVTGGPGAPVAFPPAFPAPHLSGPRDGLGVLRGHQVQAVAAQDRGVVPHGAGGLEVHAAEDAEPDAAFLSELQALSRYGAAGADARGLRHAPLTLPSGLVVAAEEQVEVGGSARAGEQGRDAHGCLLIVATDATAPAA
jgi:hypothetical protein